MPFGGKTEVNAVVHAPQSDATPHLVTRSSRPTFNTWIVICAIVVIIIAIVLLELHLRSLTIHRFFSCTSSTGVMAFELRLTRTH